MTDEAALQANTESRKVGLYTQNLQMLQTTLPYLLGKNVAELTHFKILFGQHS